MKAHTDKNIDIKMVKRIMGNHVILVKLYSKKGMEDHIVKKGDIGQITSQQEISHNEKK